MRRSGGDCTKWQNGKYQGPGDTAGPRCLRVTTGSVMGDASVETDLCIRICPSFHSPEGILGRVQLLIQSQVGGQSLHSPGMGLPPRRDDSLLQPEGGYM